MPNVKFVTTKKNDGSYVDGVAAAYSSVRPTQMMAAVAYATHSGVAELVHRLEAVAKLESVRKRWLIGIDFCRSDPVALGELDGLAKSDVRIHDGTFVVGRNGCCPRTSFHPKVYAFRRNTERAVVVGSGNLSRTGLCVGIEAGAVVAEPSASAFRRFRTWFDGHWEEATPLGEIADGYDARYRAADNRKHPMPTDDDAAPDSAGTGVQLTPVQLRRLNVCKHLWIEAGKLTRNLGPDRPGNQLMLKRNSRVFFGFLARDMSKDTMIGHIAIEYGGEVRDDCSLRFSNNSMDVLTLPLPGSEGPATYDHKTLCFEQVGLRRFRMIVAPRTRTSWKRRSKSVDGDFRMKGNGKKPGREWGVF